MKIEQIYSQKTLELFSEWEYKMDFPDGEEWPYHSDNLFLLNDKIVTDLGSWHAACINILSDTDLLEMYWSYLSDQLHESTMEVNEDILLKFICINSSILERTYKPDCDPNNIELFKEWAFYDWTKVGARLIELKTYFDIVKDILLNRSLIIRYFNQLVETSNNMLGSAEANASQNMLRIFISANFDFENLPLPPKGLDLKTGLPY